MEQAEKKGKRSNPSQYWAVDVAWRLIDADEGEWIDFTESYPPGATSSNIHSCVSGAYGRLLLEIETETIDGKRHARARKAH